MRNAIAIIIFCSMALGLLVAGCGGGGSTGSGDSSEAPLDKAAFAKQADAICERVSGKLTAELTATLKEQSAQPGSNSKAIQVTLVKQSLIPGFETELEEIRSLGAPSEGKAQIQPFFKAMEKMIAAAQADPEAFASEGSPYEGAELAGRRYGISACPIAPVTAG